MNPLLILLAIGAGAAVFVNKKTTTPAKAPATVAKIPTPAGTITVQTPPPSVPQSTSPGTNPVTIPPVKVTLPTLPTAEDYPTPPASGDVSPMLTQSEVYALANYSNDQLYNDGMSSGHLAYVAAIGTKLAVDGDTRAADMTLRVANWGK